VAVKTRTTKEKSKGVMPQGASRTVQDPVESLTMSNIIDKYRRTGVLSSGVPGQPRKPIFAEVSSFDYHAALNFIQAVQVEWGGLSARLKGRFSNSPEVMLRWLENPANQEEAIRLGLMLKAPADLYEQMDLDEEAKRIDAIREEGRQQGLKEAQKADPEAQPAFQKKVPK